MGTPKVFMREATGLVRSLSFLDQFLISQSIVLVLNGFVLTALFAPYFFPGANLVLVLLLGAIPALAMSYVYSKLSAGIPRSGGDYVWSTRILGPFFGSVQMVFLFVGSLVFSVCISSIGVGLVSIALGGLTFSLGVTTGNPGLLPISAGMTTAPYGLPISLVVVLLVTMISLFGLRSYSIFTRATMIFYLLLNAFFIAVLLTINPSTVPGLFDHAMKFAGNSLTYNGIIQQASTAGFNPSQFNATNTLLAALPWGFLTYTGFNFGTYLAGETKNVKSTMTRALFLSVILSAILLGIMGVLTYQDFGSSFLNAASYVQATNPSALPALPTPSMLASLTSPAVAVILNLGLIIGWFIVCVSFTVAMSRMIFAAAFDRFLPGRFAQVSERFHSPTWAVILCGVSEAVILAIYWLESFAAGILNSSILLPVGYMLPLLAALVFPFVRPDLFKRTVGEVASKGALALASLVGVISFAIYIVSETFPLVSGTYLGSSLGIAYGLVAAMVGLAIIIYATARARMRRFGLDLSTIFQEIPPE